MYNGEKYKRELFGKYIVTCINQLMMTWFICFVYVNWIAPPRHRTDLADRIKTEG